MKRWLVRLSCVVVIILGFCQFTDDFVWPERLTLLPAETKENESKISDSGKDLVRGESLQLKPVVLDEYGLELDGSGGGRIQSLDRSVCLQ